MDNRVTRCGKQILVILIATAALKLIKDEMDRYNRSCTISDLKIEMLKRQNRMLQVCLERREEIPNQLVTMNRIYVYDESMVYWCPVFKAGTTSWLRYIFDTTTKISQENKTKLMNKTDPKAPLKLIDSVLTKYKNAKDLINRTSEHKSFLLVRHPFSRIVSAFRDKLERSSVKTDYRKDYYYTKYGCKAVNMFRQKAKERFGYDFFSPANHFGSPMAESHIGLIGNRTMNHPIFWEFVQLLKTQRPEGMDEHWRPVFHQCSLCRVNYKHIFMYENLEMETPLIKNILNPMHNHPTVKVGRLNPTNEKKDDSWVVRQYFQQLSEKDIVDLYTIYKLDFLLFGYTFDHGNISLPLKKVH